MGEKTRELTKPVVKPIAELCVRDLLGRESLEDLSRGYRRHDGQLIVSESLEVFRRCQSK